MTDPVFYFEQILITLTMMKLSKSLLVIALFSLTFQAQAGLSPLAFSVAHKIEFPPEDFSIVGARISALWGIHRSVYGLDVGVIGNISEQNFTGTAVAGGFNLTQGSTMILGLQLAGVANININSTRVIGLQVAGGFNSNKGESHVLGLQVAAFANLCPHTDIVGAQISLYNQAHNVYGFQFGLINIADSLHGVQIGLLNYNTRGLLAVSPILNIGF